MILAQYPIVRLGLYVVGIGLAAAGSGALVHAAGGGLGGALLAASSSITAAVLGTAASNVPVKPKTDGGQ